MKALNLRLKNVVVPLAKLVSLMALSVMIVASCSEDLTKRLIKAANDGSTAKAKELIEKGADVNAKGQEGTTPLMFAAGRGHTEVARLLIEKGADVNAKSNNNWTPLIWASSMGKTEVSRLLIEKGADVNAKEKDNGWTPLMYASFKNYNDVAGLLVKKGADLNAKDKNGMTALIIAKEKGNKELAVILTALGMAVDRKSTAASGGSKTALKKGNTKAPPKKTADKTKAKGPTAAAGPITHKILGFSVVPEIPAKWTIEKFNRIAKSKPAPAGYVWYVLKGTVTNNSSEEQSVNATTYKITDSSGKIYKAEAKTAIYQPEGTSVAYIKVKPGETKSWLAFFPVKATAKGLKLQASDLTFVPKNMATFQLPDPNNYAVKATDGSNKAANSSKAARKKAATRTGVKDLTAAKGGYPELEIVKDGEMGYSIQIPKGSKILRKSKYSGHTYSYLLNGGLYEYNIHLTPGGAKSLKDLVHTATLSGSKEILEKKKIGSSGFMVIRKRAGSTAEVWFDKRGATKAINVKVWGPVEDRSYLLKIAESLRVE